MPAVFRQAGYRFHFFSNEGDPREPVHVHVERDGHNAKFWLYPDVRLAYTFGFKPRELIEQERIVRANRALIEETWHAHFH